MKTKNSNISTLTTLGVEQTLGKFLEAEAARSPELEWFAVSEPKAKFEAAVRFLQYRRSLAQQERFKYSYLGAMFSALIALARFVIGYFAGK